MKRSLKFQVDVSDEGFVDVIIEEMAGTSKEGTTITLENTTPFLVNFEVEGIVNRWFREIQDDRREAHTASQG
jgi:hypothetical protein